jgi:hypothetical protein
MELRVIRARGGVAHSYCVARHPVHNDGIARDISPPERSTPPKLTPGVDLHIYEKLVPSGVWLPLLVFHTLISSIRL